jgi:Tol biopolymer transport system component
MYLRYGRRERQLAWVDRAGTPIGRPIPNGTSVAAPSLSPDGRRTAFVRESSGRAQVSLHDWQTNRDVVFRNEPAAVVWSADGQRLAFAVAGAGIFVKHAAGGAEEPILRTDRPLAISDWTRDGRWILYTQTDPRTGPDIWLLPVPAAAGDRPTPVALLRTTAIETEAQVSPDGKWLAYVSDESGTAQVYVRPFAGTSPLPDTKWQVSSVFGREPRWRADSRELYYLETATAAAVRNRVMAVPIQAGTVGVPQPLFDLNSMTIVPSNNVFVYAPAQDGQRFLVDMFASDETPTLDVILNSGAGAR